MTERSRGDAATEKRQPSSDPGRRPSTRDNASTTLGPRTAGVARGSICSLAHVRPTIALSTARRRTGRAAASVAVRRSGTACGVQTRKSNKRGRSAVYAGALSTIDRQKRCRAARVTRRLSEHTDGDARVRPRDEGFPGRERRTRGRFAWVPPIGRRAGIEIRRTRSIRAHFTGRRTPSGQGQRLEITMRRTDFWRGRCKQ